LGYSSTTLLLNVTEKGLLSDSYTDSSVPNTNFGDATDTYIRALIGEGDMRTYQRWNITAIPSHKNITSAVLCIWNHGGAGGAIELGVYNISNSWIDSTITWNNQPTPSVTQYGSWSSVEGSGGEECVNVTDIFSAQYNVSSGNVSLVLKAVDEEWAWDTWRPYVSMENGEEYAWSFVNITYDDLIITNTPPEVSAVTSWQDSFDNIICNATTADSENATVDVYSRWYIGGILSDDFNGTMNGVTVGTNTNVANVSKINITPNQDWACEVSAFDGIDYSAWSLSGNVSTGSVPNVSSVSVQRNISGDLDCYATAMDDRNSDVTVFYRWINGTSEYSSGSTAVTNNSDTIISTLPYTTTALYDNWTCEVTPNDGTFNGTSVNDTYYFGNYPPIIVYVKANQSTGLDCYVLLYDNESTNLQADARWYRGDAYISDFDSTTNVDNGTETLVGNVPYENITNGQDWKCGVRGYDFSEYTDWVNSSVVTVAKNTAPIATTIRFVSENSALNCYGTVSDDENTTLSAYAVFYQNGVEYVALGTVITVANGTETLIGTVPYSYLASGREWTCNIYFSDGINQSATLSSLDMLIAQNTATEYEQQNHFLDVAIYGFILIMLLVFVVSLINARK
jgi:hypothetical protein